MIGKLARRFGFQQSIPVGLIDGWAIPVLDKPVVALAPREGAATCAVDQFGRVQVGDATWTLELTIAAGARWVPLAEAKKAKQQLIVPGVLSTVFTTPAGDVEQRVAAGVVDGEPVAVVEVENRGGHAIAVGFVARPLRHDGRGYIGEVVADHQGFTIDDVGFINFTTPPASVAAFEGAAGDLLQSMPDATAGLASAASKCRSGGAQVGAVWPLPHTATLRVVVPLAERPGQTAAVPTTNDINRGWESHLKQGMRLEVADMPVGEDLTVAARSLLTLWPSVADSGAAIRGLSELGFGRDAGRLFPLLERLEDDEDVLRSFARWGQLGEQVHQLEDLENGLVRLAQAAHVVAARGGQFAGPAWLDSALVTLGGRLHQIDQPDVAERIQSFTVTNLPMPASTHADTELARLAKERDVRGVWSNNHVGSAAAVVAAARSLVVEDAAAATRVLPVMPELWRGRTIDAFAVPLANGTLSFGVRWHGPRPALLWEASLAPEAPFEISAPGLDPAFSSTDRSGETLLADPGWTTT